MGGLRIFRDQLQIRLVTDVAGSIGYIIERSDGRPGSGDGL